MLSLAVLLALVSCAWSAGLGLGLRGGWEQGDVTDPYLHTLLSSSYYPRSPLSANNAQVAAVMTQIVAGTNYRVTFLVGEELCDVLIWHKAWESFTEITEDNCLNVAVPEEPLPGGLRAGDLSDTVLKDILFSFYFPNSVVGLMDVTPVRLETAVVAGTNYKITFQVVNRDTHCEVIVHDQPWTSTRKVLSDTCEPLMIPVAGGWSSVEVDHPTVLGLLREFYFPSTSVSESDLQLEEVEGQVVAGMNYKMSFTTNNNDACAVTIFIQEWTNTREILDDTCQTLFPARPLSGGWSYVNLHDEDALNLLTTHALTPYDVTIDVVEVVKIEAQVTNGFNYRYILRVPEINYPCRVVIFTQHWRQNTEVLEDGCFAPPPLRGGASMPGGWAPEELSDPLVQEILFDFYLPNSHVSATSVRPLRVESQVAAGTNYKITFQVLERDTECEIIVLHQPWLTNKEVWSDTCEPMMIPLPGGWSAVQMDDPIVDALLQELYFPTSVLSEEDVQLEGVMSQVVAGFNYQMTFTTTSNSPTPQEECKVTFFVQEWTNTREILEDTCKTLFPAKLLPGGWNAVNRGDPELMSLLQSEFLNPAGISLADVEVTNIESRVRSGMHYRFTVRMSSDTMRLSTSCFVTIMQSGWNETETTVDNTCNV